MRPTGCSILVGDIDLAPGDLEAYTCTLENTLTDWGRLSQRSENKQKCKKTPLSQTTASNPGEFNLANGYTGLSPSNFAIFTMVADLGLATHLAFLGHARSQNFYHIHDYSLVLDLENWQGKDLTEQRKKAICSFCRLAHEVGVTDVLRMEKQTYSSLVQCERDSTGDHKPDVHESCLLANRPVFFDEQAYGGPQPVQYRVRFRPIMLNHLFSGTKSVYGFDASKSGELCATNREKNKHYFPKITEPNELMVVYQLKLNPLVALLGYEAVKLFTFLAIIVSLYDQKKHLAEIYGKAVLPSFTRPTISDGFNDFILLMRGYHLTVMDKLLQPLKVSTIGQIITRLKNHHLEQLFHEAFLDPFLAMPEERLFAVSNTNIYLPNTLVTKSAEPLLGAINKLGVEKQASEMDMLKAGYHKLKTSFEKFYNYEPGGTQTKKSKEEGQTDLSFMVYPSTLISVKVGEIRNIMNEVHKFFNVIAKEPNDVHLIKNSKTQPFMLNGKYDFELFGDCNFLKPGSFFAAHQFAKHLFSRDLHRESSQISDSPLFGRRIVSPLIRLESKLAMQFNLSEADPDKVKAQASQESPSPYLNLVDPCLLTEGKMGRLMEELQKDLKEAITGTKQTIKALASHDRSQGLWQHCSQNHAESALKAQKTLLSQLKKCRQEFHKAQALWLRESSPPKSKVPADTLSNRAFSPSLQDAFDRFLQGRFGHLASPEILEMVLNSFWSLDGLLSEPLYFQLYMDVARYLRIYLKILFTLHTADNEDQDKAKAIELEFSSEKRSTPSKTERIAMPSLSFFHPERKTVENLSPRRNPYVGIEAFFICLADLMQKIVSQRQPGNLPHQSHQARLYDLKIQHFKKMVGLSWMIQNFLETQRSSLPIILQRVVAHSDLPMKIKGQLECQLHLTVMPATSYLPYFSNMAEVLLYRESNSIALNARQLTSVGRLPTLMHEIGHLFWDRISRDHELTMEERKLWDELASDLVVFQFCYAHTGPTLYNGSFNQGAPNAVFLKGRARVNHWPQNTNQYDLADDFVLSMVFQLMFLPRFPRVYGLNQAILRLMLGLAILKMAHYPHQALLNTPEEVYQHVIHPFIEEKLIPFLHRYRQAERYQTEEGEDNSHALLLSQTETGWGSFLVPKFKKKLMAHLKPEFLTRMNQFLAWKRTSMSYWYLQFLATPLEKNQSFLPPDNPYFQRVIFKDPMDLRKLMRGIVPEHYKPVSAAHAFAAAAQLSGLINLGFSQDVIEGTQVFPRGYPGYKTHREQQYLSRMRRLLSGFLKEGGTAKIREEMQQQR